ncbi:uncharacterized protein LOC128384021 [Scomber scombrus]|uniref:Uncharacterized protein LOC128384021 n=1 Tax=Scomber scombrus TaxID=13677 RepID=A0AAV1N215_SCOSC
MTEKCFDPEDSTLIFVDREDEMDFVCNDYKSLRALMSCGHSVTPMSLTDWCRYLLDQGKTRFACGQPDCGAVWSYEEVRKMALLTPEEMKEFEEKMLNNCKDFLDVEPVKSEYSSTMDTTDVMSDLTPEEMMTEKCFDPEDSTLRFVDREDEMDFLYIGYKSLRALMSCGHSVTPMSLTDWCRHLLDQGETRFVCGQTDCDGKWSFDEVRKMALLTPEEMKEFEEKMLNNSKDFKPCPGCNSSVERADLNNLSVLCSVCTAEKKKDYMFCWQCLREWKGPTPRSDRCDNDDCVNDTLETLRKCPEIIFKDVMGVTGCPSIRACPTCGQLVEHSRKLCKSIICTRCKEKFCFVCLRVFRRCVRSSSPYEPCSRGVAPRQTSIPVRQIHNK